MFALAIALLFIVAPIVFACWAINAGLTDGHADREMAIEVACAQARLDQWNEAALETPVRVYALQDTTVDDWYAEFGRVLEQWEIDNGHVPCFDGICIDAGVGGHGPHVPCAA